MQEQELVSVIIPTYNREKTIESSIRSVLEQTYKNIEVLVVDDGSNDQTRQVVEGICDSRVHYIFQDNAGACAARNKGVSLARGDYIAFQDSDDLWINRKLDVQMTSINETKADIVCCQMERPNVPPEHRFTPYLSESRFIPHAELMVGISTQTLLMRKKVACDVVFDEDMPRLQDLDWLIRATRKYILFAIKDVLVEYRLSENSISNSDDKLYRAIQRFFEKYPNLKKETPEIYRNLVQSLIGVGSEKYMNGDKDYMRILKRGTLLSQSPKDKLKYLIIRTGLYKIYKTIKDGHRG